MYVYAITYDILEYASGKYVKRPKGNKIFPVDGEDYWIVSTENKRTIYIAYVVQVHSNG